MGVTSPWSRSVQTTIALPLQFTDLHDALLADDLNPGIVAVAAGADT